jgi:hypothetical protein
MAKIILSLLFTLISIGIVFLATWFLQRSAMLSALKKFENWKEKKRANSQE